MPRSLLVVPLLAAAVAALRLGRSALVRWRDVRAARTYGLPVEQRPLLLRAAGAVVCLACTAALAVAVVPGRVPGGWGRPQAVRAEAAPSPARAPVAAAPAAAVSEPPSSASAQPLPPVVTAFTPIGHPAEGDLMEAQVAGPDGRPRTVRVWLPSQYRTDQQTRFPVIVLHSGTPRKTADAELPDVFDGVASAVKLGRARPFVVVAPEAPSGTEHPCDLVAAAPQAVADDNALRSVVNGAFRTLPAGPGGWGVLGIESGAPCAAAAGLARPDLYGAAAAVSGRYDTAALAETGAEAPVDASARLLLAAAKADGAGVGAARGLQAALHGGKGPAARAEVKVSDIVQDYTHERERLRLVRVAVQYLAESLAKAG
ncbi:alpha/beta hydrolase-fold protein [Kitasatospora sp. NPDC051914]|uniref:alpha/beta hydrolase-fold protein n=1 Tax=Kitasatospora sp. NPDC051914 TaxID=3154945 RepID=UPI00342F817A